jgi:hypothetical protein
MHWSRHWIGSPPSRRKLSAVCSADLLDNLFPRSCGHGHAETSYPLTDHIEIIKPGQPVLRLHHHLCGQPFGHYETQLDALDLSSVLSTPQSSAQRRSVTGVLRLQDRRITDPARAITGPLRSTDTRSFRPNRGTCLSIKGLIACRQKSAFGPVSPASLVAQRL